MNPIDLKLFFGRITSICDEMGLVLRRTSFSPNIKDRLDFSCALFDERGSLCAQAAHIPVHLGSMAYTMRDLVSFRAWQPGDVLALNDPDRGGTHLPDVTVVCPVFVNNIVLVGFVANRAHHADIGSISPGSMPLSQKLDEEGVLIVPTLLYRNGQLQRELKEPLRSLVFDKENSFELSVEQIKKIFTKTKFAISSEETRYYLNGVYFHTVKSDEKNILKAVATDGHRLAKTELVIASSIEIEGIILPRKFILQLDKILGDFEGKIKIVCSETQVSFEADNFVIISKLIDGKFPDYEKVIPISNDKFLEVESEPFFNAIDRISTVNQDKTPTVKLAFDNNSIKIMASSTESNKGDEEVPANYTSSPLEILFNSKYLLDLRDVLESQNINLELLNQSSPVIVKDPDDQKSVYILMPMRV